MADQLHRRLLGSVFRTSDSFRFKTLHFQKNNYICGIYLTVLSVTGVHNEWEHLDSNIVITINFIHMAALI